MTKLFVALGMSRSIVCDTQLRFIYTFAERKDAEAFVKEAEATNKKTFVSDWVILEETVRTPDQAIKHLNDIVKGQS